MGEERLRHGKESVDEKTEERKSEKKNELTNGKKALEGKTTVGKGLVVGTVFAGALALGACGSSGNGHSNDAETEGDVDQDGADVVNDSDQDTVGDVDNDGIVPSVCDREEQPMAELDVTSGWGDGEKTCSATSGCEMGITVGDEVVLISDIGGEEIQETWKVIKIAGNEVELEEAGVIGPDAVKKTISINDSGSFIWEGGASQLTETTGRGVLTLTGACVEGVCENGVAADVSNAKGASLITLYAGDEEVRVLLIDKQSVEGVEVGGYSVDLELVKATETTSYVVYNVSDGTSSAKAELGHPVREGETVNALGVTIENGVSSDQEIELCHTLAVELTIANGDRNVHNEWREGEIVTLLNGVELKVEKILAETVVNEDGVELVDQANSAVKLTRIDTGKPIVLYKGETVDGLDGDSVTVDNVVVYKEE